MGKKVKSRYGKNPLDSEEYKYLRSIQRMQVLTKAEERTLAQAIQAGDRQARKRLIECNLRLVVYLAASYRGRVMPFMDVIQEGNVGLIKAIDYFDWSRHTRLGTYAGYWIHQTIRSAFLAWRLIYIPDSAMRKLKYILQIAGMREIEIK